MFPRGAMLTIVNSQHRYAIIAICTNYPPLSRHYAGGYVTCQKDKANSDLEANLSSQVEVVVSAESNDVCDVILMKKVICPCAYLKHTY